MVFKQSKNVLVLAAALLVCLLLSASAIADGILPMVPKAQSQYSPVQGCVEPTDEMRKNHMDYILHQRDETVHEGIREKQHSLTECINCHVAPAKNENVIRADSKEHFCGSCHSFAAVHIDCFQCHSDQPTNVSQGMQHSGHNNTVSSHANTPKMKPGNLLSLFPAGSSHP